MDKTYSDLIDIVHRTKKIDEKTTPKVQRKQTTPKLMSEGQVTKKISKDGIPALFAEKTAINKLLTKASAKAEEKKVVKPTQTTKPKSATKSTAKKTTKSKTTAKGKSSTKTSKTTTKKPVSKTAKTTGKINEENEVKKIKIKPLKTDLNDPINAQMYEVLKNTLYSEDTDLSEFLDTPQEEQLIAAAQTLQVLKAKRNAERISKEITKEQQAYEQLFTGAIGGDFVKVEDAKTQDILDTKAKLEYALDPESVGNSDSAKAYEQYWIKQNERGEQDSRSGEISSAQSPKSDISSEVGNQTHVTSNGEKIQNLYTANDDLDKKIADYYRRKQEKIEEQKRVEEEGDEQSKQTTKSIKEQYEDVFSGQIISRSELVGEEDIAEESNNIEQVETSDIVGNDIASTYTEDNKTEFQKLYHSLYKGDGEDVILANIPTPIGEGIQKNSSEEYSTPLHEDSYNSRSISLSQVVNERENYTFDDTKTDKNKNEQVDESEQFDDGGFKKDRQYSIKKIEDYAEYDDEELDRINPYQMNGEQSSENNFTMEKDVADRSNEYKDINQIHKKDVPNAGHLERLDSDEDADGVTIDDMAAEENIDDDNIEQNEDDVDKYIVSSNIEQHVDREIEEDDDENNMILIDSSTLPEKQASLITKDIATSDDINKNSEVEQDRKISESDTKERADSWKNDGNGASGYNQNFDNRANQNEQLQSALGNRLSESELIALEKSGISKDDLVSEMAKLQHNILSEIKGTIKPVESEDISQKSLVAEADHTKDEFDTKRNEVNVTINIDNTKTEVKKENEILVDGQDEQDEISQVVDLNLLNKDVALNEKDLEYIDKTNTKEGEKDSYFYLSDEDKESRETGDEYLNIYDTNSGSSEKEVGDININKTIKNALPTSQMLEEKNIEKLKKDEMETIYTVLGVEKKKQEKKHEAMKILYVASECQPFFATGGLADVAGSLPKAIASQENVDMRVVIPLYYDIKKEYRDKFEYLGNFTVHLSWRQEYCGVFRYYSDGVTYYFLDNERYFKRDQAYGHYDDGEKFAYFAKAIVESLPVINFFPDIIHCNDWQSSLVSAYIKTGNWSDFRYYKIKHIYTIHNVEYQGVYGMEQLKDLFGIDSRFARDMEYNDDINLTKAAILFSDRFTTVSHSYCDNLKQPYSSRGLHHIIIRNDYKLSGILNGIDVDFYNPNTDVNLYKNYNIDTLQDKVMNKKIWQDELGLPVDGNTPMIAIVSRLVSHKGIDLISKIIETVLQKDIQLVVVGTGDEKYVSLFKGLEQKYPTKVRAMVDKYSNETARKAYGASDIFLMPSKIEPCGLSQMIASRYGSIPIVREVGGLKDSITDFGCEGGGNGYTFANYNPDDLLYEINRALNDYKDKEEWQKKMRICMSVDFSWNKPAQQYIDLYKSLV